MAENINYKNFYQRFRGVRDLVTPTRGMLTKRFDEPTYFSFRLIFAQDSDRHYNNASNTATYDVMPHPLFNIVNSLNNANTTYSYITVGDDLEYSSVKYLEDSNEPTRAQMLREFVLKFKELQDTFPYYFQSIDGISELLKTDSTKGQRITNDKKINITCLEGLDLRMSYLLNLYRKVAWDDVYQRWVLPDMMRYFTLKIYLAEFRTFHMPVFSETQEVNGFGNNPNNGNEVTPLYLAVLDDILPTWEITCEMCEFDLSDITFEHLNNLSVATDPVQGAVKFGIKVGNIKELQTYPVFTHMFLSDRKLNAINRTKDEITTLDDANNSYIYPASLQVAQAREPDTPQNRHISGMPFNERTNQNTVDEANFEQERISGATYDVNYNPTEPNTWVGNAINFGTAYAENFVNKYVDKAKMMTIPNLGISYNEAVSVLSAKDVVGAFGMIRKGVNEVVNQYGNAPSSKLEGDIQTDVIMKDFLTSLSEVPKSAATDKTTLALIDAANIALSEKGVWEKIKDYSLATNMIGRNEVNINKDLQSDLQFQEIMKKQSLSSTISKEINEDSGMPKVLPNAVSKALSSESQMSQGTASSNLTKNIQNDNLSSAVASSNLSSDLNGNSMKTETASNKLSSSLSNSSSTIEASRDLSNPLSIDKNMKQTTASDKLSSSITSNNAINTNVTKTSKIDLNAGMKSKDEIKTRSIQVDKIIEATPSRILSNKIDAENLKQPTVSKATNNKIEEQKVDSITTSKATDSKLEKTDVLKTDETSKATTQELFSK